VAGGGLQPSSQAVLLDAFPQEKQGQAMTIFGMAALLAPVVGPTLGGYITDTYGWRWIFYLNVPIGMLAYFMCHALVEDPEYLQVERARSRNRREPFDVLGLCLLAVTMVCWEVMLSKGQEWDWLGDPFYRVQALLILFLLGLGGLIYRELPLRNPLVALRTMADRNFGVCCVVIFCAYGVLYANTISLPALLQSLFGYDATTSGLVLSPSGIFAILMLVAVGATLSQLLDGTAQSGHQSVAGGLAKGGGDRGTFDAIRPAQRGGVYLSAEGNPRRRGRIAGSAAQRGRQRGDFCRPNHSATARAVSYPAAE
jgi:DHA2 family multidrug resistance protein